MRTLVAAAVCLALGLGIGFYLGRQNRPANAVFQPPVQTGTETGTRARTEPKMPTPPEVVQSNGQVPAVQPPVVQPAEPDAGTRAGSDFALPLDNLKLTDIQDTYNQARGGGSRKHEATDIMAPRGTPVRAVVDGTIQKLFLSKAGGKTIYEFDQNGTYCYYYAHLDRYADGIQEGMQVKRGDLIAYVGSTGDAAPEAPHLHFAIFQLGPEKKWWQGTPINPYQMLLDAWHRRAVK